MNRRIVIFSGGSAANSLVDIFGKVAEEKGCSLSRLVRLIPEDPTGANPERSALSTFFNHRLDPSPQEAKHEWLAIVEGHSPLWSDITSAKRELIRSFLNTINLEIVKRARPTSVFNFQSASVGNLFLTGARIFTGSLEAAIYLLSSITGVRDNVEVIPAINTPTFVPTQPVSPATFHKRQSIDLLYHDRIEDANLPGSLPTLRKQNILFQKSHTEELSSAIERIWYINPYGQEIRPTPNTKVLSALQDASCVIYSIGSLYTSILPCLILRDVGPAIADPKIKFKVLILNGCLDRETPGYTAKDFIEAIVHGCTGNGKEEHDHEHEHSEKVKEQDWKKYITHVVYLEGPGTPVVDKAELKRLGIEAVRVYGRRSESGREGQGVILKNPIIDAVKSEDVGNANGNGVREDIVRAIDKDDSSGMRYDGAGLGQALNAILGGKPEKSRRYTFIG
ncbi:hypothetical protein ACHAP3_008736 [Botrytis cinerea]